MSRWKGLLEAAVVVMVVGAVLTVGGSLKGLDAVERLGVLLAFGGFILFLVARIKRSRSSTPPRP